MDKNKKIILIDNYDSFTYNLVHYLGDLGVACDVHRNDKITVADILAVRPAGILISPGPSDPDHAGICLDLVKAAAENKIPLLGVCLGHQAIGQALGGNVIRAPEPLHGKLSEVHHTGGSVFKNLPERFNVTRYHSLIVDHKTLPQNFEITAQTDDNIIMGLSHKCAPIHGIQFHPESIATEHGHALLKNFTEEL